MNITIDLNKSLTSFTSETLKKIAARFNLLKTSYKELNNISAKILDNKNIEIYEFKNNYDVSVSLPTVKLNEYSMPESSMKINEENNFNEELSDCLKKSIDFTLKNMSL